MISPKFLLFGAIIILTTTQALSRGTIRNTNKYGKLAFYMLEPIDLVPLTMKSLEERYEYYLSRIHDSVKPRSEMGGKKRTMRGIMNKTTILLFAFSVVATLVKKLEKYCAIMPFPVTPTAPKMVSKVPQRRLIKKKISTLKETRERVTQGECKHYYEKYCNIMPFPVTPAAPKMVSKAPQRRLIKKKISTLKERRKRVTQGECKY